jgi:hypothetical protein
MVSVTRLGAPHIRPSLLRAQDGTVLRSGVESIDAEAARNSYDGVIPGVEQTWVGTTADFAEQFPDGYPFGDNLTFPAPYHEALTANDGRPFIFTDQVQIHEGDVARAREYGTTPGVEAVKRTLRHESFAHRGFMALPHPLKRRFMDLIESGVIPASELDYLVTERKYSNLADWRDNISTRQMAAEEWLAHKLERMTELPKSGPVAEFLDWLRDVWDYLTGGAKPNDAVLRDTLRQMHKALGALEPGQRIIDEQVRASQQQMTQRDREYMAAVEAAKRNEELIRETENRLKAEFYRVAEEKGGNSPEAEAAYEAYLPWRKKLRDAEEDTLYPTQTRVEFGPVLENFQSKHSDSFDNARKRWDRRGEKVRDNDDLGGVFKANGSGVLFRGVSLEDYARIKSQGFIDTDFRGAISSQEGINLTPDARTAASYMPTGADGVIMAIDTDDLDLYNIGADSYIRSFDKIPVENIIEVTEPVYKSTEGTYYTSATSQRTSDIRASRQSDPINNNPSFSSASVPKTTAPRNPNRMLSEIQISADGIRRVIPKKYLPFSEDGKFGADLKEWAKDLTKVKEASLMDLRRLLMVIRDPARTQAVLGITPQNDGQVIRISVPPLTEERRKDIVKQCKKMAEEGKLAVRNIRRDANEELKKAEKTEHFSEDERKRGEDDVQKNTDKYVAEIDKILAAKEVEVMEE